MKINKKVFTSEIKGLDEKELTLTAFISTNTIDRMGEVLDPKGVDLTNYQKNPIVLWAHDYSMPPIGKALWVKKTAEGVMSKVKFATTEFAKEIFELYKGGFLKAFSVGFIPKTWIDGKGQKDEPSRTFTKWEMLEYSAVPVPANPDALSLAMQKGLTVSDSLKHMIEKSVIDTFEFRDEEKPEDVKPEEEPAVEPVAPIAEEPAVADESAEAGKGLEDLIAENTLLKEQLSAMEIELGELRYEIYKMSFNYKKKLSEITVDKLASKTFSIMDGVIRKATGKVD